MNGNINACLVGGVSTILLVILNKFVVFIYFVETVHALRACTKCRYDSCGWTTRWPTDYVWSILNVICFLGSMAAAIHSAIDFGQGQLLDGHSCVISQHKLVVEHVLIWHASFHTMLFFTLLGISICTMKNFPRLNDVTACQYKVRSVVTKFLPLRPGSLEEPAGSNIAVICPAYLVPLNERSAGRCECSALKAMATLSLTIVPSIIDLGVMLGLRGIQPSWLVYLLCEIDGKCLYLGMTLLTIDSCRECVYHTYVYQSPTTGGHKSIPCSSAEQPRACPMFSTKDKSDTINK
jgi:hypothetical protein